MTVESRVFPPYLQSARVLHEKAFLINRPAPLEFDKNRREKDLINPQSFQFGVFCMSEVCFLQRSQAGPILVYRDNILPFVQPWFTPSLPGEVGMKRFSEVIASAGCKGNLDSHTDGGPPEEGKDDVGFHCSQVRESIRAGDWGQEVCRKQGGKEPNRRMGGALKVNMSGTEMGQKGENQLLPCPVLWSGVRWLSQQQHGQKKPSLPE